jgi:hypothetical protein
MVFNLVDRMTVVEDAPHDASKLAAARVEDGDMVQPSVSGWRRRAAVAYQGVQADMVVVVTRRKKGQGHPACRFVPSHCKAQHVTVEGDGPVEIRDPQMGVADTCFSRSNIAIHRVLLSRLLET